MRLFPFDANGNGFPAMGTNEACGIGLEKLRDVGTNGISLTDHAGNHRRVLTADPQLFNRVAREYQYNTRDAASASMIETSSSAVVHLIDAPLLIE